MADTNSYRGSYLRNEIVKNLWRDSDVRLKKLAVRLLILHSDHSAFDTLYLLVSEVSELF